MRRRRPTQDLTEALRTVLPGSGTIEGSDRLSILEEEHRILSQRRRRLHQSIDMLSALGSMKPDAAAMLERYKRTEAEVSRQRGELHRTITALRSAEGEHSRVPTASS